MKELCNEYVNFKYIRYVFSFNISENIDEPFEMFVRWADPQKIDLRERKKVSGIIGWRNGSIFSF